MTILRNLSLRTKLISGFTTVLVLLTIVTLTGFKALDSASRGFTQYREMARDANLIGRLHANMLMVRMNVKNFLISGSQKDQQQYQHYYERMEGFLKEAQKEINAPERAKKIDQIDEYHITYNSGFHEVEKLQIKNKEILDTVMVVKAPQGEKALTAIMTSAEKDSDAAAAYHAGLALRNLLLARLYGQKFLTNHDMAAVERVDKEAAIMQEQLDMLDRELQNPERRKRLAEATEAKNEYFRAFEEIVRNVNAKDAIVHNTLDKIGPQIAEFVEEIKLDIKGVQDEIGPVLQASNQKAVTTITGVSVVAVLVGIVIVFFTTRSIISQLGGDPSEIADVARQIAVGNLAIEFKHDGDKPNQGVYLDMESMTSNLRQMFTDINSGVETLTSSATELSAISEQMTQSIQSVSDKSNTVSTAAEEMSANMNNVAAAMEQSATNTNMVASASEEMSSTIGEIAQNAEKARGISDEAAQKSAGASTNMDQLGAAANSIGKVIETITDISEQVNLLALNATIEAARAGEAGKGFAVVANEIKDLAKQTAEATQNIKGEIEGIQGTTSMTVDQIIEITKVINEVNSVVANIAASVEQQSAATKEIATNVAQSSTGIQEVNENVNQSTMVSGEISQDIAEVSMSMNEMSTSSSQVNLSARELSKLSENLKQMVDQFKI
ncbi:methyl-accepting chemotaxis protein [Desulfosarcina ovata subsp. sediminis]|uniref:Methyl-accepting chemotaxis protein n=1 Tax=Desulfosarcina ovata subsp. sediminis TaxID=885957 RepID=A0A5K7ZRZ0_9BACT|nr:methyl-accepting chemotaxis protein [Desulfosarcina ovata]BBO82979.1 methyl-accepting chemotaxis protein [Desulfosarcina ovata subsp. sediminis]